MKRKLVSLLLICSMVLLLPGMQVSADSYESDGKPYLALGADLNSKQKATVLELLGVDEADLENYTVVTVTNKEEHEYLGDYLSDSVIGTKALSSVLVKQAEKDTGIGVTTQNINYCTDVMYCNALVTAGIEDADVVVAGPFPLTGTAALVGTIKAYAAMTGTEVSKESIDAATNELVLTGMLSEELEEELGDSEESKETAGELMALVKQKVVEEGLTKKEDIVAAVAESCEQLDIQVSDDTKEQIASVMGKISKLDLNLNTLKTQAKDLYNKLADLNIDTDGLWDKIVNFFSKVGKAISDFFSKIFG